MTKKPLILRRKLGPTPAPSVIPTQAYRGRVIPITPQELKVGDVLTFTALPIGTVFMIDVLTSAGTKVRVLKKINELMAQDARRGLVSVELRTLCTVAIPVR